MESSGARTCPQCGEPVQYGGVGRRPVWCSTRCRNDAALTRRGARLGGIEVRLVEVEVRPRRRPRPAMIGSQNEPGRRRTQTADEAVRTVLASPELVGSVLSGLERIRLSGNLGASQWQPVRGGLLAIARSLSESL